MESSVMTIRGQRKSFQVPMNVNMASVTRIGLHRGRMSDRYILKSPAPSIRAASMRLSGIESANWRIRKIPNTLAIPGMMTPI